MRFRVDTLFGYASFDESEEERAWEYYETEGTCIRLCRDLFDDEGTVLAGAVLARYGKETAKAKA